MESSSPPAAADGTTEAVTRRRPVTRRCVCPPLRSPLPIYGWTDCPKSLIYTKDKSPAGYKTAWEDLHSDSQQFLLQIEQKILDHKYESMRLDQCSCLYKHSEGGFQLGVNETVQDLAVVTSEIKKVNVQIQQLAGQMSEMCLKTKAAVRSYCTAIPSFVPSSSCTVTSMRSTNPNCQGSHVLDHYGWNPKRPSAFLQSTVSRFEDCLKECSSMVAKLEEMLVEDSEKSSSKPGNSSIESFPAIMSDIYELFVRVAAKVERLHQCANSMRTAYLAEQRRGGDMRDPFFEAERRQVAEQEAATRSELLLGQGL